MLVEVIKPFDWWHTSAKVTKYKIGTQEISDTELLKVGQEEGWLKMPTGKVSPQNKAIEEAASNKKKSPSSSQAVPASRKKTVKKSKAK